MYICIHRGPQVQKGGDKRRPSHLKYIVVWMDDKEGIVLFVLALRALQSSEEKKLLKKWKSANWPSGSQTTLRKEVELLNKFLKYMVSNCKHKPVFKCDDD